MLCLNAQPAFQRGALVQDQKFAGAEGRRLIEDFRNQRLSGDYAFRFELQHMPRRGSKVLYSGVMYGSWNKNGPVSRIEFLGPQSSHKFILQNGPTPRVWSLKEGRVEELSLDELTQPLWDGVIFTPFDFLQSFIYWPKFTYSGTKRVQGRPGHFFTMYPSEEMNNVRAVKIALDTSYNFLLKSEIINQNGEIQKTLKLNSFKKVQGEYIIKEADLVNELTRDKTRFEVNSAALGLNIDGEFFDPQNLNKQGPQLDNRWFSSVL